MLFDDILCKIGEFGIYQVVLYALLGLVAVPTGWQHFSIVFIGGHQEHWCRVSRLVNLTHAQQRCISVPDVDDECRVQRWLDERRHMQFAPLKPFSRCHVYDLDYGRFTAIQYERWNRTLMLPPGTPVTNCSSWEFDTTHFKSTLASDMELVCERASLIEDVQTMYICGFIVGSVIFGMASDRFGRHRTLILTLFLEIVFGVSAALVPRFPDFLLLRFLDGTAVAGSFNTAFVMIMENIGPSRRMAAGIFVQGWFSFGIMSLSAIAYAVRDQRKLQFLLALPVVFLLIYYWIVPESPRWYASHGKFDEAEKVLRRMAAVNGRELPERLHLEENRKQNDRELLERFPCVIDLFRTRNLRTKACLLYAISFADAFAYRACVSHLGPVSGNMYLTTFLSGAVELPAFLVCVAVMNRVGRRWPIVFVMTTVGTVSIVCVAFLNNSGPLTAFSMVGKLVAAAGFASIRVYSAETFPTSVRNGGIGLESMFHGFGSLLAKESRKKTVTSYPPCVMLMAAMFSIGAAILAFLLPETVGHNLPETLGEGEAFGRNRISRFLMTGDIHKPFITRREQRESLDLGSTCTLKMGALKMELLQIPQSI